MALPSKAEQSADLVRELPGFNGISLPGIRQSVTEMLRLIGRGGFFTTYTKHDITHIDAMLGILDWLVPEDTKAVMTPVDWLLVVLAIYFHDLGLAVTDQEFNTREENSLYMNWLHDVTTSPAGREYQERAYRMSPEEKERFFFQEYIRVRHAKRIKEWVAPRYPTSRQTEGFPFADEIDSLLTKLPSRFRDHLGQICESHHLYDLDDTNKYPIVGSYGLDSREHANVQYAALLLRTADLLHVTRGRTPSIDYRTVRFSDPKSVYEWEKQMAIQAVNPKVLHFEATNPESTTIVITADFTEKRSLFAFEEYVAYANEEIRRSSAWAKEAQSIPDAKFYSFPWQSVIEDVKINGVRPRTLSFALDRPLLLELLVGHRIYNDNTAAIRELLQNAIDAVRYQYYLDERSHGAKPAYGKVLVEWNPDTRYLDVSDTGIGMTRDVIEQYLLKIGSSFYQTRQFQDHNPGFSPISRFGIGILSCFMISDEIEVTTFSAGQGNHLSMTSVISKYLLLPVSSGDPLLAGLEPHGTRVRIRIRGNISVPDMEAIVRHWIILPECPVEFKDANPPRRIGFATAEEALRQSDFGADSTPHIITTEVRNDDSYPKGVFTICLATQKTSLPGYEFTPVNRPDSPRICIEGIRVSNTFPGMTPNQQSLSALLLVRRSPDIRTTASRNDLDHDDSFRDVLRICGNQLFDHVSSEAKKIAEASGGAVSRAAVAIRHFKALIAQHVSDPTMREFLDQQFYVMPSILLEDSEGRRLISEQELEAMPHFWTLDSKDADHMLALSLDLGREISLAKVLSQLGASHEISSYLPFICDAPKHITLLTKSHVPDSAIIHPQMARLAIRWMQGSTASFVLDVSRSPRYLELMHRVRSQNNRDRLQGHFIVHPIEIQCAEFPVDVIVSRLGTLVKRDSSIHSLWVDMRTLVTDVFASSNDVIKHSHSLELVQILFQCIHGNPGQNSDAAWRELTGRLQADARQLGLVLPSELPIIADRIFNVAKLHTNWNR